MDCVDTLYIADHNNHRIRRITSATMGGRPESGTVVSWANVRSRLRMGVLRESLKDGAEIHQSLPSPRAHQQWRLIPVGSVTGRHPEGLRDREPQQRSASPRRHQRPRGDQAARGTGRPPGPAVAADFRMTTQTRGPTWTRAAPPLRDPGASHVWPAPGALRHAYGAR
ncbi:hypothetical protein AB0P04_19340 [Streptomyces anulatus]